MSSRLIASVLGLLVMSSALLGCTSSPAPEPEAIPQQTATVDPVVTEPSWDADLIVTREFPDADGTLVECTRFMRITPAPASASAELVASVAQAQERLASENWADTEVTLDAMDAYEQQSRRAQGVSDPELHMMVLGDVISDDITANGYVHEGMSYESFITCA